MFSPPAQLTRLFVGMDVHKDNHAAVAANCFGEKIWQEELGNSPADFKKLICRVRLLSVERGLSPVFGLEDTSGSGHFLARHLFASGLEVKTVNPVLVKNLRQYETHPEKSDLADALGVAKVLIEKIDTLPAFSITETTELARDLHALVKDRETIVREQTRLKNQLHKALHTAYGSPYKTMFKNIFAKKALLFWINFPSAKNIFSTKKHIGKPNWIIQAKKEELPATTVPLEHQIQRKAKRLLAIWDELNEIEKETKELVEQTGQQLNTLRGCGTTLSATVLSETKDIARFATPAKFAKYAGIAPKRYESGKKKRCVKTKSGNRRLHKAIYQIALTQISNQGLPKAKDYFKKKVAEGKSKKHALVCLMRQISDIIYSMLKNKRAYYP